jgi:hypothetical protein
MAAEIIASAGRPARRCTPGLIVRWVARALMLLWGAFWLWFAIADGLGDWHKQHSPMPLIMELLVPLVGIAVLAAAWRWELAGGILFIALAATFQWRFHYHLNTSGGLLTALTLLGPPLLTGLLLIASWLLNRRRPAAPASAGAGAGG